MKIEEIEEKFKRYADILKNVIERRDLLHQDKTNGAITYHSDGMTIHYNKENGRIQSAFVTLDGSQLAICIEFSTEKSKLFDFRFYNLQVDAGKFDSNELFRLLMNISTIRTNEGKKEIEPIILLSFQDCEHIKDSERRSNSVYIQREERIVKSEMVQHISEASDLKDLLLKFKQIQEYDMDRFIKTFDEIIKTEEQITSEIEKDINSFKSQKTTEQETRCKKYKDDLNRIMKTVMLLKNKGIDEEQIIKLITNRLEISETDFYRKISTYTQIAAMEARIQDSISIDEILGELVNKPNLVNPENQLQP